MIFAIILVVLSGAAWATGTLARLRRGVTMGASFGLLALASLSLVMSCVASVGASRVGVVTTFGKIEPGTLQSGIHLISPFSNVTEIYLGQQKASTEKNQASSSDLQSVHADLVVNYSVTDGRALYAINTTLDYQDSIVDPSMQEVFKAVVSKYTAEELVTKRQQASDDVTTALTTRLLPYHIKVNMVNFTNFGFSPAFDEAIEKKVTASQQAETAKRNLEKVQYEAQGRVEQAKGEAEAISIQTKAIQDSGGAAYIQLQAIAKWDGKMPQYVGSSGPLPMIGVK